MWNRVKPAISRLLIGFVLISIGFTIGKEWTLHRVSESGVASTSTTENTQAVSVIYMHGTARCATCNKIERQAKELVNEQFNDGLASGKMVWKTINFQKNEAMAKRYKVSGSTVVIIHWKDGQEVAFKRMNRVWELVHNEQPFKAYLAETINEYLTTGKSAQ